MIILAPLLRLENKGTMKCFDEIFKYQFDYVFGGALPYRPHRTSLSNIFWCSLQSTEIVYNPKNYQPALEWQHSIIVLFRWMSQDTSSEDGLDMFFVDWFRPLFKLCSSWLWTICEFMDGIKGCMISCCITRWIVLSLFHLRCL